MPDLLIPDISEFQPDADLGGIARMNGGAVIIRAAYGLAHPDASFARHRAAAAGFRFCGIYQYLVAGQDVRGQAAAFVRITGKLAPHEIPILDLEEGDGTQYARALLWCAYVDTALGLAARPPDQGSWLYSGLAYASEHGLAPIFASPRRTWVAAYGSIEPDLGHTLWQCTDGKTGINRTGWPGAGYCDTSVYHGTLARLSALITPQGAPVATVTSYVTTGRESLAEVALEHGTEPSVILRLTLQANGGTFPLPVAGYINTALNLKAPMDKGITLRVPA